MKKFILFLFLIAVAGAIFIYSGRYDISATTPHFGIVKNIISMTMNKSVRRHARDITVPGNLEDTSMVRLGFEHYQEMCAQCHGAPGVDREEFAKGLYPHAPKLKKAAEEWSPAELYWMTKNGIKMSGMPAFGSTHDEKELWAIVAFMNQLPKLDSAGYAKLALASKGESEHH